MKVGQEFGVLDGRQNEDTKFLVHLNSGSHTGLWQSAVPSLYESATMMDLSDLAIVILEPRISLDLIDRKPVSAMILLSLGCQ
jgi:hypothetical protein